MRVMGIRLEVDEELTVENEYGDRIIVSCEGMERRLTVAPVGLGNSPGLRLSQDGGGWLDADGRRVK